MARRLKAMGAPGYERGFELTLHAERLDQRLRRKTPTRYFVNSMSDLFHEAVPDSFVDQVLDGARCLSAHTAAHLPSADQASRASPSVLSQPRMSGQCVARRVCGSVRLSFSAPAQIEQARNVARDDVDRH
jgi:hypothetical protein